MEERIYEFEGIDCPVCALKVEEELSKLPNVEEAHLDFLSRKLYVKGENLSREELKKAGSQIEKGFFLKEGKSRKKLKVFTKDFFFNLGRIFISLVLALIGRFVLLPLSDIGFPLYLSFAIVAWLISGYDLFVKVFRNLRKRRNPIDESLLMLLASLGAFLLPLLNGDLDPIFDAVLVVVLYQVGELFDDVATKKSREAIVNALSLKTKNATLIEENGNLKIVQPEELRRGDLVLIKVGESIPADGRVNSGFGTLDCSSLTGESLPISVKKDSKVYSGTILKTGSLEVFVEKEYKDSTAARILNLVEASSKEKAPTEKFISKFAKVYTPIVFILALIVFIVPPLFLGISDSNTWASWAQVGLSFLVISCPCAIVIAIPLTYFAGIGLASKNGIVVKGSVYLDTLREVKLVVSDKTGTLTKGEFKIVEIMNNGIDKEEFLKILASIEQHSNHPLARAILASYNSENFYEVNGSEEQSGGGISALINGEKYLCGSQGFLEQNGVILPEINNDKTAVFLAKDHDFLGYATFSDQIKEKSKQMVDGLHDFSIKTAMLTGDRLEVANVTGKEIGIDEVHAELKPEDKTELLREMKQKNSGKIAFIGDGINDAPALALADVGIAMGGIGSDAAVEAADVIIMQDDPVKVVTAISIGRKAYHRAIVVLFLSLLIKLTVMILSLIFRESFPLWVAVLSDTGLAAVMIFYALSFLLARPD